MKKNYVIYGDTHFAEELFDIISLEGRDCVVAFTNDRRFIRKPEIKGLPVIPIDSLRQSLSHPFQLLFAYGYVNMNGLREKVYNECRKIGMNVGTYISTKATCYTDHIGEGTVIWPNVYIGPGTRIGLCNIIQASCTLAHDNQIGNFNYFAPGVVAGGRVRIDNCCFMGLNSTIKSDVHLANMTLLGSGCNMIHDSEDNGCYMGNPACLSNKRSVDSVI